ncbi:hypothetical protein H634G_10277 [Metarhizium anisopliae BRIP 53293]|uniref:Uncharacterized protein n=1 Tax=Metarhizium anisopliae BRIP 53293 TaxID=1291518 RepID=A0A0D9NP27_METAN|nr:hypothetical protein H634G_10277 [Metarhizium anisopliae BRIP 53293]
MPPAVPFQPSEAWIASITTVTIEEVTLCAIGILATVIRVCGRARAAGFKGLRADDYLASVGALFYAILTTLSVCIGYMAWALTNASMADEQRAALAPDDAEFQLRVMGSKFQIGRWDPINGSRLACLWASREVFVAVVTTNLPIVFPRFVRWFTQVFGLMLSLGSQKQSDRTPTGFRSFGGGGKYGPRWLRRGPPSPNPITDLTLTASQVEMIDGSDLQLLDAADRRQRGAEDQSIKTSLTTTSLTPL